VLLSIGAEVEYVENEGYPPLRIRGKKVRGGFDVRIAADTSSQFASSLMMAGATLPDGITLHIASLASAPYIDITASILTAFGAHVERGGEAAAIGDGTKSMAAAVQNVVRVRAGGPLGPRPSRAPFSGDTAGGTPALPGEYRVEGDYSSASYWFAAAAATRGRIRVRGLVHPSAQGDSRFLEILETMGCRVTIGEEIVVEGADELRGGRFDCNATPDLVPTLAAIAPLATGPVEIVNVANLRVKESDRLATVTSELRRLGATVDEQPDALRIEPGWSSEPATVQTHDDHRIAMAFAIAGLARGNVTIANEQVVSKSYPRFWKTLDELTATALSSRA
jgi:3-phosphoshikimate 1-carboxyvinyltransferase